MAFAKLPMQKEGDTEEACRRHPSLAAGERPSIPREKPSSPGNTRSASACAKRSSARTSRVELLDAVEIAIDHQKDAVIVPMRDALRRAPTVPEHARRLVDKLNNSKPTTS